MVKCLKLRIKLRGKKEAEEGRKISIAEVVRGAVLEKYEGVKKHN